MSGAPNGFCNDWLPRVDMRMQLSFSQIGVSGFQSLQKSIRGYPILLHNTPTIGIEIPMWVFQRKVLLLIAPVFLRIPFHSDDHTDELKT